MDDQVYLLQAGEYDEAEILAAFLSAEAARQSTQRLIDGIPDGCDWTETSDGSLILVERRKDIAGNRRTVATIFSVPLVE